MTNPGESDDELELSSSALDALKQFYAERDAHAERFAKLQAAAEEPEVIEKVPVSMDFFIEDWNESQFWYADETAMLYAHQLLEGATADMTIALVSAPSVFVALKKVVNAEDWNKPKPKVVLLEHDNRFAVFPEFIYYDYAHPLKLPASLKGTIDRIMIDPPFLSEDCQTKFAVTARWLTRPTATTPKTKFIICTGERCKYLVAKLYRAYDVHTTNYEVVHARGLSNEFWCYANFEVPGVWKFTEDPAEE